MNVITVSQKIHPCHTRNNNASHSYGIKAIQRSVRFDTIDGFALSITGHNGKTITTPITGIGPIISSEKKKHGRTLRLKRLNRNWVS